MLSTGVGFADSLFDFKQPPTARDTIAFEARCDSEAYRLIRPALIGNDKVCIQRIKSALAAFDRGVK